MRKLKTYDLIASGIEEIMSIRRPTVDRHGGLNARVVMPPVALISECFLEFGDEDAIIFRPEDVPPDLHQMVNVAFMLDKRDEHGCMVFWWVRTPTVLERRRAQIHTRHMLTISSGNYFPTGWDHLETHIVSFVNGSWRDANRERLAQLPSGAVMGMRSHFAGLDNEVRLALSIALTMRYEWSAILTDDPGNLSARIFAHPDTVRFLLRTREIGNAKRRRALMHLVRFHKRRRRRPYPVRTHLRGEHRCRWAGLDVAVLPSQFDLERAAGRAVPDRLEADGLRRWIGA